MKRLLGQGYASTRNRLCRSCRLPATSQSKRVSWGKADIAAQDTNWRSGSTRMANDEDRGETNNTDNCGRNGSSDKTRSRPEDDRPPKKLKLNLQPRMEKEANSLAPRSLWPTPIAYPHQTVLANVTTGAKVVYVVNPMDFYCQLTQAIEPLDTLMAQLSKEYAGRCHFRFENFFADVFSFLNIQLICFRCLQAAGAQSENWYPLCCSIH